MLLGTYLLTRPKYSTPVVVAGTSYYYSGGVYYVSSGTQYVVTAPPPGAVVYAVPAPTTVVYSGSTSYYYYNGTYYQPTDQLPSVATAAGTVAACLDLGPEAFAHREAAASGPVGDRPLEVERLR